MIPTFDRSGFVAIRCAAYSHPIVGFSGTPCVRTLSSSAYRKTAITVGTTKTTASANGTATRLTRWTAVPSAPYFR